MNGSLKTIERQETGFQMPEFWDRSVVFFANLKSLFLGNDEQTAELAYLVGEIDTYGGRLASVLNLIYRGRDNVLVLERFPEAALLDYFRTALDLKLPRIETLSFGDYQSNTKGRNNGTCIQHSDPNWVDGYVTDDTLTNWATSISAQTISTKNGCRIGNNKTKLYEFLAANDLPTPDTHVAASQKEILEGLAALKSKGYRRAVIRAAIGASGIGMIKADLDNTERIRIPAKFFHGGPCLVQGWFERSVRATKSVTSPSVQLFLDESTVHMFDITDQILSEQSIHEGNHSPPRKLTEALRAELIRQAGETGEWLHQQGYRSTASVDFLVVTDENDYSTVYVCEINARITGATYPSVVGRHLLPGGAWLMRNLRLESPIEGARLLELIDDSKRLFRKGDSKGVVPLNFNFGPDELTAKGQFLCLAETVDGCHAILDSLVASLPFKTRPERD